MGWFPHRPPKDSKPVGQEPILYRVNPVELTRQDHYNWVWPVGVTQYGARVTQAWYGNQLPNSSIGIPGVSEYYWKFARGDMQHKNVQLKVGNTQTSGVFSNAKMLRNAQQAWLQRGGF